MFASFGLTHIQINVSDLERSLRFYQTVLGMQELFRLGEQAVMVQTPGSKEVFTINCNPDAAEQIGKMGGIAHFGFRLKDETDMEHLLKAVEDAGGKAGGHGSRGANKTETYAFAFDPDGYELEFFWMPVSCD